MQQILKRVTMKADKGTIKGNKQTIEFLKLDGPASLNNYAIFLVSAVRTIIWHCILFVVTAEEL